MLMKCKHQDWLALEIYARFSYLQSANGRSAWMVSKELFVVSEICKCTIKVHNYLDHIPLLKTLDQSDRSNAAENLFKKNIFEKKKKQNSLWPPKKRKGLWGGRLSTNNPKAKTATTHVQQREGDRVNEHT
jgi:hypothetical protein